jgi:outer membrane protein
MKKMVSYIVAGLLVCGASLSVSGAENVTLPQTVNQNTMRIGILDMRQVMEKSPQVAKIRESLRKEFQPRQQKIMTGQNTLKDDTARLRRDNAIMNDSDRKQLEQKILTEQQDLQKMQATFQQDLMNAQNKAVKGFLETVKNVVEKVASADNLNLVFTKDTIAYVKPSLEITNKVVQQLPRE